MFEHPLRTNQKHLDRRCPLAVADTTFAPAGEQRKLTRLDKLAIVIGLQAIPLTFTICTYSTLHLHHKLWFLPLWACIVYAWRTNQDDLLVGSLLMPFVGLFSGFIAYGIARATPVTIDGTLAAIDHGSAVAVWHWCVAHPYSNLVLIPVYYGLSWMMLLALWLCDRRTELIGSLILALGLGLVCYYLFPATGPKWAGTEALRNAMPSLHMSWAFLLAIYCRKSVRWAFLIFAALTAFATVGTGEHYAIDLVAAIPFTALVCFLTGYLLHVRDLRRRVLSPLFPTKRETV